MDAYLEAAFSRDKLEAELRNPCSEFFFLVVDGTIAGYMKLNEGEAQTDLRDPQGLEVERIYVKSGFLGRGLGKVLLRAAEHRARQKGKTFLWLGVWEKNTGALGFYRHMGFRKVSTHDFSMGDERQTDYVMRKEAEQP
jgi:diamine N-acetyltransferase